jgi:hypothetical protein
MLLLLACSGPGSPDGTVPTDTGTDTGGDPDGVPWTDLVIDGPMRGFSLGERLLAAHEGSEGDGGGFYGYAWVLGAGTTDVAAAVASVPANADDVIGDVDGDGVYDWVAEDLTSLLVYSGAAVGTLAREDALVAVPWAWGGRAGGDLDGDGIPDLLATDLAEVWIISGTARGEQSAASVTVRSEGAVYAVAGVGDVTGDGAPDLVVNAGIEQAWLLPGPVADGAAVTDGIALEVPGGTPIDLAAAGDVDGDGYGEIVAGCRGAPNILAVWGASFEPVAEIEVYAGLSVSPHPAADVDGDGRSDLAFVAYDETTGAAAWLVSGPLPPYAALAEVGVGWPGDAAEADLADADGDGAMDLLIGLSSGYHVDGGWADARLAIVSGVGG